MKLKPGISQRIKTDPVWFCENILKENLWEKEKEILTSVRDHQQTTVRSCHASGKTYTAARVVNWWLLAHPKQAIVITTAPTFRQVKEILWREIRHSAVNKALYPKNAVHETQIKLSEQWFALGLSTDVPDQFQGFHSPHLLVVVDEASGVDEEIYEAIDGLVYERILMIGNPLENAGRFADAFKKKEGNKIAISAFDTPNVKEEKQVIPGLITKGDVDKMASYYGKDSDVYRVRILGEFPLQDAASFISVDAVAKAIQREVQPLSKWEKKMGVDVARYGDDRSCLVIRQMEKVLHKEIKASLNTMEITGEVLKLAKEHRVKPNNIFVDEIGVGAGVVDRLKEQGWGVSGVNVANQAKDTENYSNLRTELYGKMKEWLATGDLPHDDDWYEVANVQYSINSKGQLVLEKKEDMKKRGLESPDVADALALTFAGGKKIVMPPAEEPKKWYDDQDVPF